MLVSVRWLGNVYAEVTLSAELSWAANWFRVSQRGRFSAAVDCTLPSPAHYGTLDRPAAAVRNMGIAAPAEQTQQEPELQA
jgi:hypothetical protein